MSSSLSVPSFHLYSSGALFFLQTELFASRGICRRGDQSVKMRFCSRSVAFVCCSLLIPTALGNVLPRYIEELVRKQLPAEPTGVTTLMSPKGMTIRFKEPGKEGVCETTPGVNSYSGYVDLDNNTHMFFYFFEARCVFYHMHGLYHLVGKQH